MRIRINYCLICSLLVLVAFAVTTPSDNYNGFVFTTQAAVSNESNKTADDCPDFGIIWKSYYGRSTCYALTPGPDQVVLYQHRDYNRDQLGVCTMIDIGRYAHSYSFSMPNDSLSSIRVGSRVKAILHSDACYEGREETFSYSDSRLSNNYIGNDSVSSVEVLQKP